MWKTLPYGTRLVLNSLAGINEGSTCAGGESKETSGVHGCLLNKTRLTAANNETNRKANTTVNGNAAPILGGESLEYGGIASGELSRLVHLILVEIR